MIRTLARAAKPLRKPILAMLTLLPTASLFAAGLPDTTIPNSLGVQLKADNNKATDLDQVKDLGLKYVRRGFIWESVEKTPGVYDWTGYDRLMKDCKEKNISVLGCIALNNSKLYGHVKDDKAREAYAKYAAALVERYKDYDIIWEIWNEPNTQTFWGKHGKHNTEPYADEYVKLVKAAVPAMKKANPNCFVMAGSVSGLWSASFEWMQFCFDKGVLKSGIDAWSVHPYAFKSPEDYLVAYDRMRKMFVAAGVPYDFPVLNSERGFPIGKAEGYAGGDEKLSAEYQAWHVVRQYMVDIYANIHLTIWYEWSGKESFSLFSADGDTPAYKSTKVMLGQLNGYKFDRRLETASDRDFVFRFTNKDGGVKLIAWAAPPAEQSPDKIVGHEISIPVEGSGSLDLAKLYGDKSKIDIKDGKITLAIDGAPQYITVRQ